jgi:hypothetical protein
MHPERSCHRLHLLKGRYSCVIPLIVAIGTSNLFAVSAFFTLGTMTKQFLHHCQYVRLFSADAVNRNNEFYSMTSELLPLMLSLLYSLHVRLIHHERLLSVGENHVSGDIETG